MITHLDSFNLVVSILSVAFSLGLLFLNAKLSRNLREIGLSVHPAEGGHRWFSSMLFRIFKVLIEIFSVAAQESRQKGLPLARIFLLFVSRRNREHIIGDLEEEYRTSQKRFPRCWYWGQVFALLGRYWWAGFRRLARLDMILKLIRK